MAESYDMEIRQGSTYSIGVVYEEAGVDLSGFTARAKIRSGFESSSTTLGTFTCTVGTVTLGVMPITVSMSATDTAALTAPAGVPTRRAKLGHWDIEIVSGATVKALVGGAVYLTRESTT